MATKWKNKGLFAVWVLLLTFGLSGVAPTMTWVTHYANHNYYESSLFYDKLGQFANDLSMYELNFKSLEEAKKDITVSPEEIKAYRYYYGDLSEQISNIKGQYEESIQEARINNNKVEEEKLIAERDTKIEDITKNFESDDYVKEKIIKEKEDTLENYYQQLTNDKADFEKLAKTFKYYFKNSSTGEEYTNVSFSSSEKIEDKLNTENMAYITDYYLEYRPEDIMQGINWRLTWYSEVENAFDSDTLDGHFEGYIAVPKMLSENNVLKTEMDMFQKEKKIIGTYSVLALVAFILFAIIIFKIIFKRFS